MCVQETSELFRRISSLFWDLADRPLTEDKARVIDLLLECDFVELVQKMWQQYLSEDLLKQKSLPPHIRTSLGVMHFSFVRYSRHKSILCSF